MNIYCSVCLTGFYHEKYITLLLEHYNDLKLPYSFPVALSYISSPVLLGKEAILVFDEEEDEPIGAAGYIHGTGPGDYLDTDIIQIQAVFLKPAYRKTRVFLQLLQFILQYMEQSESKVTEIRFWIPAGGELSRLCAKLGERVDQSETGLGQVEEYRAQYSSLYDYVLTLRTSGEAGIR
ncbi:hypothetical protein GCM10010912_02910 [Paenibacillus albidus]|uniref:N-acetyltransferase domain-containing protein n=1 Tax=Paenibacillus albidus TaxID=2041023 RepID=A0A917FA26_9BACL|nr:GNAT family N-acetyltransferase [Paenibacillus albidus]GGF61116.1 hypothetical protein GCM10010912_02910 [Paenibacillus albidus]